MKQKTNVEYANDSKMGVDEKIKSGYTRNSMEEGFGAASGVRPDTASSGGRITAPEIKDGARGTGKVSNHFEKENSGSAE